LVAKGKAKRVEIEEAPGEIFHDIKLELDRSFNANLYRFSTKLAANTAISMGRESVIKNSGISQYLHGKGKWGTGVGYCDTSRIRSLRPPLSHAVYVEFGARSHAIVVIFGEMQVYVPLPAASPGAALGFLDPITGEESFEDIAPIGLVPPPPFLSKDKAQAYLREMLRCVGEEAKIRGATNPPDLQLVDFDLGRPASLPQWVDGTYKFLKKIP